MLRYLLRTCDIVLQSWFVSLQAVNESQVTGGRRHLRPTLGPIRIIFRCGCDVDNLGHNGLSPRRSAERLPCYAALNDGIRLALATVNEPALLEPNDILRHDRRRSDGMTLGVVGSLGFKLCRYIFVLTPPRHVKSAGRSCRSSENIKRRKYVIIRVGYIFLTFEAYTMGP